MSRPSPIMMSLVAALVIAAGCSSADSDSLQPSTSTAVVESNSTAAPTTVSPTTTFAPSTTTLAPTTAVTEPPAEPSCVPRARSGRRSIEITAFRCVGDWANGLDANVGCSEECEGLLVLHKVGGEWRVIGSCNQYSPLYPGYQMCVDPATGNSVPDAELPPPQVACELWDANTWEENLAITGC